MSTTTVSVRAPRRPASVLRQILAAGEARFDEHSDPVEVLKWFGETLGIRRIAVATSFADSMMAALGSRALPGVDLLFVDTGYHFAETLGLRDAVATTMDVNLRTLQPRLSVAEQNAELGPDLWRTQPDRCCALRKQAPIDEALRGYDAWATGLRRADHAGRSGARLLEWDAKRGLIKINPLVAFSDEQVAACEDKYGLLANPLTELGYASIGCAPCTRPVTPGEDRRAGRWAGNAKTECGLHL